MPLIQFHNTLDSTDITIDSSEFFSYLETAISASNPDFSPEILNELEQLKKLSSVLTMETINTGHSEYLAALFTVSEPAIAIASSLFYMGLTCSRLLDENNLKIISVSTDK